MPQWTPHSCRRAHHTTPLQAQAQEEEEEREEELREHEAEQARAAAAEAQRREESLVQEREAVARREAEAARRREAFEAEREHERRGQAPGAAGAAVGLGLEEALGLLRSECAEEAALADALQALQLLCSNVVAHPEEQRFRTIRLLNANFQARRGVTSPRTHAPSVLSTAAVAPRLHRDCNYTSTPLHLCNY